MINIKVGLIGGGSWGTTVAALVANNAPIMMWARDQATVDEINQQHRNDKYLPGATLPDSLKALSLIHI